MKKLLFIICLCSNLLNAQTYQMIFRKDTTTGISYLYPMTTTTTQGYLPSYSGTYFDQAGAYTDKKSILTINRTDTTNKSANSASIYIVQLSRGDSGATFNGRTGIYSKTIEDTSNGGSNGRKRGVLIGGIFTVAPITKNEPYMANRDATNLILDNQGSKQATEAIYIGGSAHMDSTTLNPLRYQWINFMAFNDTAGVGIQFNGCATNIGIDLSTMKSIGASPVAIKTSVSQTSSLGVVTGATFNGATITPSTATVQQVSAGATTATTGTMTTTMTSATQTVFTITPTGACTFNASGGKAGARMTFVVTTSGTSSFVLTFGTNFKSQGTLTTGTTTAKVFAVTFVCKDGTLWVETGRTIAM